MKPNPLAQAVQQALDVPAVLLPYQQRWIEDDSPLKVIEKSRRTGLTWGEAADDVLTAAADRTAGGQNVYYIAYNQDMTVEYIQACAMWARAFNRAATEIEEGLWSEDEDDKHIKTFTIRFPESGFRIVALTSRPSNLRGRQGVIVIDEAAFHEQLYELLKAALAMLIWGGAENWHEGDHLEQAAARAGLDLAELDAEALSDVEALDDLERVLDEVRVLPQAAWSVDSSPNRSDGHDYEISIDVERLNIDAASFRQMEEVARSSSSDIEQGVRTQILDTVEKRGKMHNPVTGSGGMLLGRVRHVGSKLSAHHRTLQPGDRIAIQMPNLLQHPVDVQRIPVVAAAAHQDPHFLSLR